jgi:micrococcal nuclease
MTKIQNKLASLFFYSNYTISLEHLKIYISDLFRISVFELRIFQIAWYIFIILFVSAGDVPAQNLFTVKWVNDGDTIVLTDGQRVRYIGINSPEIDHDRQKAQPFGYAAKNYNKQMVLNRKIRLEFDQERHDRYGRLLAYVFLPDGIFLNEHMLQKGYAFFLFRKPNLKYNQRLLKAQQEAMKARKGIWNSWSEQKKRYVASRNSRRFHMESCPNARKIKQRNRTYFDTKWDAFKAGYAPAGGCIEEFWSDSIVY